MAVMIAGVQVHLGDRLYSRRSAELGRIVKVDPDAVQLLIESTGRVHIVTNGGNVGGTRDVYWHPPLMLDLPKGSEAKVVKLQTLIATVTPML